MISSLTLQRGFSFWGLVFNMLLLGVVLVLVLRIAPAYMEYLTVKDVVERAAADYNPAEDTLQDVRTHISKLLRTSQVYDITIDDIEVYRERNRVIIDATYERRFPLFWIIDGVMNFDDLKVETAGAGT